MSDLKQGSMKLFNKYFIYAVLASIFYHITHGGLNYILSVYVLDVGGTTAQVGYMGLSFGVCAIIGRFLCGRMIDKKGRRLVMVLTSAVYVVTSFLFGVFPYFLPLFILRSVHGFNYAPGMTVFSTAAVDCAPKAQMTRASGMFWATIYIAAAVGGSLALRLTVLNNYPLFFAIMAAFSLIAVVFSALCRYEKDPRYKQQDEKYESNEKGLRKFIEVKALPAFVLELLLTTAMASTLNFLYLFTTQRGYQNADLFLYINAVLVFLGGQLAGKYNGRISSAKLMAAGYAISCAGLVLIAAVNSAPVFYICGALIGLGQGVARPVSTMLAIRDCPMERRGAASSTYMLAADIGTGGGTLLWGLVIEKISFEANFYGAAIIMGIAIVVAALFFGKRGIFNKAKQS